MMYENVGDCVCQALLDSNRRGEAGQEKVDESLSLSLVTCLYL